MDTTTSSDTQQWGHRRAARLRNLYGHGLVSLVLVGIVVLIDAVASRDSTWFHWPALGLAVGWAVHAVVYAAGGSFLDEEWQARKAAHFVERRQGPGGRS